MIPSPTDLDAAMAEAGLVPGQSPSPLLTPEPSSLFARRAARLRALAPGHQLEPWLAFVAQLCDAQHKVAQKAGPAVQPAANWPKELPALLDALDPALPEAACAVAAGLAQAEPAELIQTQERILAGHGSPADLAAAPFLAAAEQLAWTRHAAAQDAQAATPSAIAHLCPVCGRPPVAGIILAAGTSAGLRYLCCGTCGSQWHHVRAACTACGDGQSVSYRMIEGGAEGVRAECCDACNSALKLLLLENNPAFEPVADDLASVALDILVGEAGYHRTGGNPFLAMSAED